MTNNVITDKILSKIKAGEQYIKCTGCGNYDGIYVGGYRYSLAIEIENPKGNKTLGCIMMNPSTTFPDELWEQENYRKILKFKGKRKTRGFDPTVKNVIRMAYAKKYNKVIIFNVFPYIEPNGTNALKYINKHQKENIQKIEELISENQEILIAWGSKIPQKFIEKYLELLKKKNIKPVAYEWNKKVNCPYHPSQQVDNRFTKDGNGEIRQKIKGKKEVGIITRFINNSDKNFENLDIEKNKLILK